MANQLDEMDETLVEGRDINVINKKIKVEVATGYKVLEVVLWCLGIIPGLILLIKKINAKKYFQQLQQKLQHDASTIDNYLEQRVMILQNAAKLVQKAVDLDKDTFKDIAKFRSGADRNENQASLDAVSKAINVAFENYPELKAHQEIEDAMQQNSYLQREITAAREQYNDTINQWNAEIFKPIANLMVAGKEGYTTRIPFAASQEIKQQARGVFF